MSITRLNGQCSPAKQETVARKLRSRFFNTNTKTCQAPCWSQAHLRHGQRYLQARQHGHQNHCPLQNQGRPAGPGHLQIQSACSYNCSALASLAGARTRQLCHLLIDPQTPQQTERSTSKATALQYAPRPSAQVPLTDNVRGRTADQLKSTWETSWETHLHQSSRTQENSANQTASFRCRKKQTTLSSKITPPGPYNLTIVRDEQSKARRRQIHASKLPIYEAGVVQQ